MRLVQFTSKASDVINVGVEVTAGGDVRQLAFTGNLRSLLAKSESERQQILSSGQENIRKRADVVIKSPITDPEKVICVGMNYFDHCEEQNAPIPTEPLIFSKFPNCITHPGSPIYHPTFTSKLDWEVELAIVIGKAGKHIPEESAMEHVLGYTVAHDVSARDWQLGKNGGQWLLGKTCDTFLPLGPSIVTVDELGDPHNLRISCRVNGETVQDSTTAQLVFKTEQVVSWCSKFFTLTPGDVISTGTPPGVGCFRKPPVFLKVGDVVECEVEKIGVISNTIEAEPAH